MRKERLRIKTDQTHSAEIRAYQERESGKASAVETRKTEKSEVPE